MGTCCRAIGAAKNRSMKRRSSRTLPGLVRAVVSGWCLACAAALTCPGHRETVNSTPRPISVRGDMTRCTDTSTGVGNGRAGVVRHLLQHGTRHRSCGSKDGVPARMHELGTRTADQAKGLEQIQRISHVQEEVRLERLVVRRIPRRISTQRPQEAKDHSLIRLFGACLEGPLRQGRLPKFGELSHRGLVHGDVNVLPSFEYRRVTRGTGERGGGGRGTKRAPEVDVVLLFGCIHLGESQAELGPRRLVWDGNHTAASDVNRDKGGPEIGRRHQQVHDVHDRFGGIATPGLREEGER